MPWVTPARPYAEETVAWSQQCFYFGLRGLGGFHEQASAHVRGAAASLRKLHRLLHSNQAGGARRAGQDGGVQGEGAGGEGKQEDTGPFALPRLLQLPTGKAADIVAIHLASGVRGGGDEDGGGKHTSARSNKQEDSADEECRRRLAVFKLEDPPWKNRPKVVVEGGVRKLRRVTQAELEAFEWFDRYPRYLHELRLQRHPLLAVAHESVSVGTLVKLQDDDHVVNFYQLACHEQDVNGTRGAERQLSMPSRAAGAEAQVASLFIADHFPDGVRAFTVDVGGGGGTRVGTLLVFLAPGESAQHKNQALVEALSANSGFIDAKFWGILPLAPTRGLCVQDVVAVDEEPPQKGGDDASTALTAQNTVGPLPEPNHGDYQAFSHQVHSLPALVLTTASGNSRIGRVCAGRELVKLCQHGGAELSAWLHKQHGAACSVLQREREEQRQSDMQKRLRPVFLARSSAAMIHGMEVRLLLIEPEGVLKKRTNVSLKRDKLPEGQEQDRDSFLLSCVPFLRAVLLPADGAGCGSIWHPAAPSVALCTDFGQQVAEGKVRKTIDTTLDNLLARIAAELGVSLEHLFAKVSLHVSYDPDHDKSGLLRAGMTRWNRTPYESLCIGFDPRDRNAASDAGVPYISGHALLHTDDPHSQLIQPGTALPTQAPADFNPGARGFKSARGQ